jgi:hypothetical protein
LEKKQKKAVVLETTTAAMTMRRRKELKRMEERRSSAERWSPSLLLIRSFFSYFSARAQAMAYVQKTRDLPQVFLTHYTDPIITTNTDDRR